MNSTHAPLLEALAASVSSTTSPVSLQPSSVAQESSPMMKITSLMTKTMGNQTYEGALTYVPGNDSLVHNVTAMPETRFDGFGVDHIIVILSNIFVVLSIAFVCFLAFKHKKWETEMRRRRMKENSVDYALVDSRVEGKTEDVELKTVSIDP
ncbi:uncharacterized protein [Diadema setosum]|uniref:uncharacterized protein n=1 Tax=Diadema setosum TaxID=31175 RepID=UPI003B3B6B02